MSMKMLPLFASNWLETLRNQRDEGGDHLDRAGTNRGASDPYESAEDKLRRAAESNDPHSDRSTRH